MREFLVAVYLFFHPDRPIAAKNRGKEGEPTTRPRTRDKVIIMKMMTREEEEEEEESRGTSKE